MEHMTDLANGAAAISTHEVPSLDILASSASLKAAEGPALVVFSGGTAFNSVAGKLAPPSRRGI